MTTQEAYELYRKRCKEWWNHEPPDIELYERIANGVTGLTRMGADSFLNRSGTAK